MSVIDWLTDRIGVLAAAILLSWGLIAVAWLLGFGLSAMVGGNPAYWILGLMLIASLAIWKQLVKL